MTSPYDNAADECDIIMKGGITSGIVYPKTVLALAKRYKFRNVGGASAGAIAAAITAAAEYGRDKGGFAVIELIPAEMGTRLPHLFQPTPEARTMYTLFYDGWLRGKWFAAVGKALLAHWPVVVAGLAIGTALAVWAFTKGDVAGGLAGLFIAIVLAAGFWLVAFTRESLRVLKDGDFGLCPGRTQGAASGPPAISDWLARTIETAAGRIGNDGALPKEPLTFGEVWKGKPGGEGTQDKPRIDLKMMTTNLSMKRPSVLPKLGDRNYYFRRSEFLRLFPDWVVDFMCPLEKIVPGHADLFYFPDAKDLPVVVATRMSLSFPFLFSAVPLYRNDYGTEDHMPVLTRILFSDGGISSNFPIHFFDNLLPRRPTFGVSLDDLEPWLQAKEAKSKVKVADPPARARLPAAASSGQWTALNQIGDLKGFIEAVIYTAKDWQDSLQSTLPGYRERIVHVHLNDAEGGLNLAMGKPRIDSLVRYGGRAGGLLVGEALVDGDHDFFDFDDHRWRRFLVAFARMEETLSRTAEVWYDNGFRTYIDKYLAEPKSYGSKSTVEWRRAVFQRVDALMNCVDGWRQSPLRTDPHGHVPSPATDLRITARPED